MAKLSLYIDDGAVAFLHERGIAFSFGVVTKYSSRIAAQPFLTSNQHFYPKGPCDPHSIIKIKGFYIALHRLPSSHGPFPFIFITEGFKAGAKLRNIEQL